MNEDRERYGTLLTPDIKIHRQYFRELCKLQGIRVLYRAPKPGKTYTTYAELESNYQPPLLVGCIFDEHPTQRTLRKIGWVSELSTSSSIIHVDYDLPDLQQGAIFIIPGGLDGSKGRLFRVTALSNEMVYPASIACEIVPEFYDTFNEETAYDYSDDSYTLLKEPGDGRMK